MIDFVPEKEAERLLQQEVRDLALPEGGTRSVRISAHAWELYELILQTGTYSHDEIMALARSDMKGATRSFDEAFTNLIAYIHLTHDW